jgi:hypothetical protein
MNNTALQLDQLPSIENAPLPVVYENAKTALANCDKLDECKDWADKSAALASYAKQAKDDAMYRMAVRIQSRAIRRAGELLSEIEKQQGANQNIRDADGLKVLTRTDVAKDAGMSTRQQKTAIRVASIPQPEFNQAVESDKPPTITKLAIQGTKPRPRPLIDFEAEGITEDEFKAATKLEFAINYFNNEFKGIDIDYAIRGLMQRQKEKFFDAAFHANELTLKILEVLDV